MKHSVPAARSAAGAAQLAVGAHGAAAGAAAAPQTPFTTAADALTDVLLATGRAVQAAVVLHAHRAFLRGGRRGGHELYRRRVVSCGGSAGSGRGQGAEAGRNWGWQAAGSRCWASYLALCPGQRLIEAGRQSARPDEPAHAPRVAGLASSEAARDEAIVALGRRCWGLGRRFGQRTRLPALLQAHPGTAGGPWAGERRRARLTPRLQHRHPPTAAPARGGTHEHRGRT